MATAINSTEIAKELSALIETRVQRTFEFVNTCPVGGSPQSMHDGRLPGRLECNRGGARSIGEAKRASERRPCPNHQTNQRQRIPA